MLSSPDPYLPEAAVSPDSDEHRILEQYLMLCVRSSRVKVVRAYHIESRLHAGLRQHRASGKQRILCWIDANNLDENNRLQDILRRGFVVPSCGMTFPFGALVLPGLPLLLSHGDVKQMQDVFPVGERRLFQFILCQVVVGLAIPESRSNTLQNQFDSIVRSRFSPSTSKQKGLSNGSLSCDGRLRYTMHFPRGGPMVGDSATVGVVPVLTIAESYTVFDSSQLSPLYVVQVESNPCSIEKFAIPLCDNCVDLPAALWCGVDKAKLCGDCDDRLHAASQLAARHSRFPLHHVSFTRCSLDFFVLTQRPRRSGKCMSHPNEEPTLFCCICRIPACRLCGPSHAHGARQSLTEQNGRFEDFLMAIDPPAQATKFADQFDPPIVEKTRKNLESELNRVGIVKK
ncbi:uncharacterized protein LOC129617774 [Condylostylus longicornis]|uniref:uncharacterized protein LOC129617774 n=1 Tax=Condylostylus longicornis TaxID=2530218 RepID=UPI00244E3E40|nr:uncharacterized protein LOC129617774 [Condylostylus longicornis]